MDWLTNWGARAISVLVVLGALSYTLYKAWPDTKHQLKGYTFAEVLPKTVASLGADARVVEILTRGTGRDVEISFVVLTREGKVHVRFYGDVCHKSSKGSSCSVRELNHERDAT